MCIPALEAIRARWPNADIVLLARPWVADLLRGQPFANRLLLLDHNGLHQGFFGMERLVRQLHGQEFDVAVLLQNAFEAAWIAWRAGIPERIGYARDGRSWLLTHAIAVPRPGETPAHECYYYLELLRRAGWIDRLPELKHIRLHLLPGTRSRAEEILRAAGASDARMRLAMAPGAAFGTAKCWPPERYAALADRLIADFDADVILFGAVSERAVAHRVAAAMQRQPVMLVGRTVIGDLPGLLAACDLFVGNDSGVMHVAGAVGLPVVAVFGPTDPRGTAAMAPRVTVVQQTVSCSPCFLRHCPVDHRCMCRVDVQTVYAAVRRWIAQESSPLV